MTLCNDSFYYQPVNPPSSSVLSGHLVSRSYLLILIFLGLELGKFVSCQCHNLKLIQGLGQWPVIDDSALRSAEHRCGQRF